jgi:integrase
MRSLMMRLDRALDRFDGDMARRDRSLRSRRDYFLHLRRLFDVDGLPVDPQASDVTLDVIRDCLDLWADATPSTRYKVDAMFRSFCRWLYVNDLVDRNPMDKLPRPTRPHPDDIPLRVPSGAEVRRLFDGCETWRELLCLSTLAYFGSRRGAVSRLRRRHLDLETGWITFHEKGAKIIDKPISHAYLEILTAAIANGAVSDDPNGYVIPILRNQRRPGERDDRVIWRLVKVIGKRVGVETHPHALRHAFSVRFLEQHPGEIEALQRLLDHSKIETTQRYLRAMERRRLMERGRDLTWETRFEAIDQKAPSGLEPLYEALQASA